MKNYKKLVIFGLLIVLVSGYSIWGQRVSEQPTEPQVRSLLVITGSSVKASVIPSWFKPPVYGSLIDCISWYESSHNPEAVGDRGKAYGILQFWESTFDFFSEKYGLSLEYTDPEAQRILAEYMLQSDFNNILHWSVWDKCI